jgi:preprotein translocase subunit YajC
MTPAIALLQAAAPNYSAFIFQIVAIGAIIYFLLIRPQSRQRKQQEERLSAIKRGDEIVTAGGIVGEIVHIKESSKDGAKKAMEDRITIRSGESRFIIERGKIARVLSATDEGSGAS